MPGNKYIFMLCLMCLPLTGCDNIEQIQEMKEKINRLKQELTLVTEQINELKIKLEKSKATARMYKNKLDMRKKY